MPLTDVKIRQAKPADKSIKLADSGGLYIEVKPNGSKLWRYRYRIAGKENIFAIGEYPQVSLQDARKSRDDARELVKQGINPSHARKADKLSNISEAANTFKSVTKEFLEQKSRKWSPTYLRQFGRVFESDVYPRIGHMPIRKVKAPHILDIIQRMDRRGATTYALQVRQWCSAVFRFAVATLRADTDPASALRGALQRGQINHAKAMDEAGIKDYLTKLETFGGYRTTAIALRLILILFVRTVELRKAEWSEFDLDAAEWRIPAARMKMRRIHIVPLPNQAVTLLRELWTITGNGTFLFPNTRDPKKVMSATTINRALEYLGYATGDVTGHDFRATASTRLHEMGYNSDHIEMQMAHAKKDKTKAAYNHAQYLAERRRMMQEWADWLDSLKLVANLSHPAEQSTHSAESPPR